MNTNTIPQRLRDIAEEADRYDRTVCNAILEIANELEAPAADAVPVVAQASTAVEKRDGVEVPHLFWFSAVGRLKPGDYLVRQRDHLAAVAALQARINELEARQWTPGSTLPPRHKNGCESITVLAWAETGDGCFQLTPAKVLHMSKGEWREVRFDHDGMGRKIVVRCWTQMPKFPRSRVGSQPDTSKEQQ